MLLGVISLNKKHDDASNSVYRFDSALRAVEAEFVGKLFIWIKKVASKSVS